MSHLRLVPKLQESAGCVPCAQACEDGGESWCMCDCHLLLFQRQLAVAEAALARATLRASKKPLVRLIK